MVRSSLKGAGRWSRQNVDTRSTRFIILLTQRLCSEWSIRSAPDFMYTRVYELGKYRQRRMAKSPAGAGLVAMTTLQTGLPVAAVLQNLAPILAGKGVPAFSSYCLKNGALSSAQQLLRFCLVKDRWKFRWTLFHFPSYQDWGALLFTRCGGSMLASSPY